MAAIARRSGAGPRATASATHAAPNNARNPRYSSQRAADRRPASHSGSRPASGDTGAPDGGACPTPNTNEPAEMCPSTDDTARQDTVNTPSPGSEIGTRTLPTGSATAATGPLTWSVPLVSRTLTSVSRGSGVSLKVSSTLSGGLPRVAPAAGVVDRSSAWAETAAWARGDDEDGHGTEQRPEPRGAARARIRG